MLKYADKYLKKYILMIISGIILIIPFHYSQLFIFSWLGFIPAIYCLLKEVSTIQGFIKGWILGIFYFTGTAYWLYYPMAIEGLPLPLNILLLLILFVILGSIYGIWAVLFLKLNNNKNPFHPFYLALSWTGIEYLRYILMWFFPIGFLGYTQTDFLPFLQTAEIGGVFIVTFLILLINGYLFKIIFFNNRKSLISLIILIFVIFSFGNNRLNYYNEKEFTTFSVGVIQTNILQKDKWLPENIETNIDVIINKAYNLEQNELIITPESSLTFDFIRNEYYRNIFEDKNAKINTYLQAASLSSREGDTRKYNSIFLISPNNEIVSRYDKNKLVLFGEYIPLENWVRYVTGLNLSSLAVGETMDIFSIGSTNWKNVICSEILNSNLVRKNIENADFIVNPSNEAWFSVSGLQNQMWQAAVFRAVENRISVVKSGNLAYNGLINPSGKYDKTSIKEKTARNLRVKIYDENKETIYQKWGSIPGYISLAFIILFTLKEIIVFIKNR